MGGTTETYAYAGDGLRLSASTGAAPGQTTQSRWDRVFGLPQLVLERDGAGTLQRSYRYGLDLLSQTAGATTYGYQADGLGSVADVTSSAGASLSWSEFYPYGQMRLGGSGAGAPAANPFAFSGEQRDGLTGLYHLRARQYDPGTGRFLTTDPAQQSIVDQYRATYAYANLNPILYVDPSGLDVRGACITGEGALAVLFGEFALCAVVSDTGQAGVILMGGAGGGAGLEATAGVAFLHAFADEIYDLEGPFVIGGGSGALIVGVQGEGFAGAGHCGQIVSGAMGGVAAGAGASAQVGASLSAVLLGIGPPKSICEGAFAQTGSNK